MLLLAAQAWAGAFVLVDSGVRAQGRAGAFVAGADDLSAQWYNPAALDNLARPMLKLDGWVTQQAAWFEREDIPGVNPFDEVASQAPPVVEPSGGFATRLGGLHPALRDTSVAVGLTVPTGSDFAWPADGPQRYAVIDSSIRQAFVGPTVAQRITPWLVVGAGVQYTFLQVDQSLVATLCNAADPEACGSDTPTDDVRLDISALDPARVTWNAGVLLQPHPALRIGASVQPGIHYEAVGSTTSTLSEDNGTVRPYLTDASFRDDDITLQVDLPWTARLGLELRPVEALRVELAGTWTGWSATDALRVTDVDLELTGTADGPLQGRSILVTDDVALPTGFVDTWSVRLGAEWHAAPPLRVRAGVYGESGATPDGMANPAVVDGTKAGGGLGATVLLGAHAFVDVGGGYAAWLDRSVTDSTYAQPALLVDYGADFHTTVGSGRVIGNGEYRSSAWTAGLGLGWSFGGR